MQTAPKIKCALRELRTCVEMPTLVANFKSGINYTLPLLYVLLKHKANPLHIKHQGRCTTKNMNLHA